MPAQRRQSVRFTSESDDAGQSSSALATASATPTSATVEAVSNFVHPELPPEIAEVLQSQLIAVDDIQTQTPSALPDLSGLDDRQHSPMTGFMCLRSPNPFLSPETLANIARVIAAHLRSKVLSCVSLRALATRVY